MSRRLPRPRLVGSALLVLMAYSVGHRTGRDAGELRGFGRATTAYIAGSRATFGAMAR